MDSSYGSPYSERNLLPTENFRQLQVSLLSAGIGILAGFVAYLLYHLIGLFTNLFFFQRFSFDFVDHRLHHLGLWVIIVPVLGGIVIGFMAKYGTSKIKGHGIPEAMEAVVVNRSRIAPRVAFLKPISAAIAIGTGGPFGAEGPIIQTGGALGSLLGQIIRTTASERKVLLACGAAAGMSATFGTPIAAVILAIELLLFEFKARSFIPLVIASVMATSIHYMLMGGGPMFKVSPVDFGVPNGLPFYVILGIVCGLAAAGFTKVLYKVEDLFERLPFDELWHPAIGALALGVIGYFFPRVFGVGYDTITDILNNNLALTVLLSLMVFKTLALVISIGSGTSGGLLAPLFMSSAAMGGVFAITVNQIVPSAHLSPAAYALVAMAAVFGAASRATFTFIIFAFEITHDYNSILPLMLVSVIADGIALPLMRNSVMTEKLARRGLRIHQEYEADPFQQTSVADVMDSRITAIHQTMTVTDLADRIAAGDPQVMRHHGLPIINDDGALVGIITRGDVLRAIEQGMPPETTILETGSATPITAFPDESLHDAIDRMLRNRIGRLPVVQRENSGALVGYIGRAEILEARRKRMEDESLREEGWIAIPSKHFRRRRSRRADERNAV